MIRIGFIVTVSKKWMGGLNYFKNLLYALSKYTENEIEIFIFVGQNTDNDIKEMFREYAIVIENSLFDRKSLKGIFYKIENKLFKTNYLLETLLKKYNIQILSHSNITNLNSVKTINWIPDFQHLHLPEMFSKEELLNRDKNFMNLIQNSNKIILSSYSALADFKTFAPQYIEKVEVLQFVSQVEKIYFNLTQKDKENLYNKYNLKDDFFYIPNQFWKHKNHMLVFKAVKLLVDEGRDINIVCTGDLNDYRNKDYMKEIQNFIKNNSLEKNIKLLGVVDYEDVFLLIKFSVAVINPSLFEGWSSTVEECKSVGKNMILSNLDVHKEQYPEVLFFNRNSAISLKDALKDFNVQKVKQVENLEERTKKFAKEYRDIAIGVFND